MITRSFTMKLQGDKDFRYVSENPGFVDLPGPYLIENTGIFDSPHEYCMVSSLEFARRYPSHYRAKWAYKEFSKKEIEQIVKGDKKLFFKSYNIDPEEFKNDPITKVSRNIKKILPRLFRPDFSKEPVELVHIYDYWLEGDDPKGKPRGGVDIPQFSKISLYKAELNKWVGGDTSYTIMADLEFCRRNPKHAYAKESQFFKLFSNDEILDILQGRKRFIIENCS